MKHLIVARPRASRSRGPDQPRFAGGGAEAMDRCRELLEQLSQELELPGRDRDLHWMAEWSERKGDDTSGVFLFIPFFLPCWEGGWAERLQLASFRHHVLKSARSRVH